MHTVIFQARIYRQSSRLLLKFIATVLLMLASNAQSVMANQTKLTYSYSAALSPDDKAAKDFVQNSQGLADVKVLVNREFTLTKKIDVQFGAEDGPLFAPDLNVIMMPYWFVDEVKARFNKAKYQETGVTIMQATEDAMMHTVLHELAHALIYQYQIPVLGKEEDAADSLANVLLIEFFENGQEIVLSAADLFDLESTDRNTLTDEDFWDEHSLDEQRYYTALCHVYGSASDKYQQLVQQQYISSERAEYCIEDYAVQADSWLTLLAPYLSDE